MKRLSSIEVGALIFGLVCLLSGLSWVVWPRETVVSLPGNDEIGWAHNRMGRLSKTGVRFYGAIATLVGAGLVGLAVYRQKR